MHQLSFYSNITILIVAETSLSAAKRLAEPTQKYLLASCELLAGQRRPKQTNKKDSRAVNSNWDCQRHQRRPPCHANPTSISFSSCENTLKWISSPVCDFYNKFHKRLLMFSCLDPAGHKSATLTGTRHIQMLINQQAKRVFLFCRLRARGLTEVSSAGRTPPDELTIRGEEAREEPPVPWLLLAESKLISCAR